MKAAIGAGILIVAVCAGRLSCPAQTEALANDVLGSDMATTTLRKDVKEVNLLVTVTDHRKHFVSNLTPEEITIQDNGTMPERLTYFDTQTNLPLRVAVVIDTSSSVTYCFGLEKQAAGIFFHHILRSGSDQGLIVGFNEHPWVAQDPTTDYRLLSKSLKKLRPGGSTAVYDAVGLASRELANIKDERTSRRVIILVTDGEDNSSRLTLEGAGEVAQDNDVIIYVLHTSVFHFEDMDSVHAMKYLAESTGGRVLPAEDPDQVDRAFSKLEAELRNQYAIGYKPRNIAANGAFHRITVIVPKKLVAHHRQGYFARALRTQP